MRGAELGMRVRSMKYLRDRHARRLMLARIGLALSASVEADPSHTYLQLCPLTRSFEERLAVWVARSFRPYAVQHSKLRAVLGIVPWYLRMLMAIR